MGFVKTVWSELHLQSNLLISSKYLNWFDSHQIFIAHHLFIFHPVLSSFEFTFEKNNCHQNEKNNCHQMRWLVPKHSLPWQEAGGRHQIWAITWYLYPRLCLVNRTNKYDTIIKLSHPNLVKVSEFLRKNFKYWWSKLIKVQNSQSTFQLFLCFWHSVLLEANTENLFLIQFL